MNIIIREMKEKDVENVYDLGLKTPELHVDKDTPFYYSKDIISKLIRDNNAITLVAEANEEFAGFRLGMINPTTKEAYLSDLAVVEEFRGIGIGSKIMSKTLELLKEKGCTWVWALVKTTNEKMQGFIENNGFSKGSEFHFYHRNL